MEIKLTVMMPTEEATLPLVRHLVKYSLFEIGVTRDCIADVELALTEACANVVIHARADDEYEIEMTVNPEECEIRVIDTGHGMDFEALNRADAADDSESGRGIQLMRALVDKINFSSQPESGTVVHLVKRLDFDGHAPDFINQRIRRPSPT